MFFRNRRSDLHRISTRRRPSMDSLEGRQLMSVGPEFFAPINTTTRNNQFNSDNASSNNGTSVVVWTDTFSSSDHDIRAQRFDRFGSKLGPEIAVSLSGFDEDQPKAAMDSAGNFVVSWTQTVGNDTNVVARRFNSSGNPVGDVVQVGSGTFREFDSDVAVDDRGDFVVSYTRNTNNNNPDVFAKRYDGANLLLNVEDVAISAKAEGHSSVAMSPDGRFVVAWEQTFSATDHDVLLSRYTSAGSLIGVAPVALSGAVEDLPSVSVDNGGNAVVAYRRNGRDILARKVSAAGTLGNEIAITLSQNFVSVPSVAAKRGGGGFVVAYQIQTDVTQPHHTRIAEVSASGVVSTVDAGVRFVPAVSINGFDDYIVSYTSPDGSETNIRGRRGHLFS